jgi:hypothetical protein
MLPAKQPAWGGGGAEQQWLASGEEQHQQEEAAAAVGELTELTGRQCAGWAAAVHQPRQTKVPAQAAAPRPARHPEAVLGPPSCSLPGPGQAVAAGRQASSRLSVLLSGRPTAASVGAAACLQRLCQWCWC